MFKHDTMEKYVADSLAKQAEAETTDQSEFALTGGVVVLFASA